MTILASAVLALVTMVAAIIPTVNLAGTGGPPPERPFPAPEGYLLPWEGGRIHAVTQGEETSFTHNLLAAYAYDFDLNYDTVVAARGGRVSLVREDSNAGGCSPLFASATNYVVIDHGDGTSGAYLHLAYNAVLVEPGQLVAQGEPLAVSGETGVTCGADGGPGAHLHFQVQRTEDGRYFTQSLPVAFDDISKNSGVPSEGESYASGNYGPGKPQKIALTPYRVPRVFNPQARPQDPMLVEAHPTQTPVPVAPPPADAPPPPPDAPPVVDTPTAGAAGTETPGPTDTAEPTATETETPTATPTDTPTDTPTALPTDTPPPVTQPAAMATPVPSDTAAPAAAVTASTWAASSPSPSPSPSSP